MQGDKVCRIGEIAKMMGLLAVTTALSTISIVRVSEKDLARLGVCIGSECGHWVETCSAMSREDHSGGKECIFDYGAKTNRVPYRTGPCGSLGKWNLDAQGYCGFCRK